MPKVPTRELMEEILSLQKKRVINDLQIAADISVLMNKQADQAREQNLFNQKISSVLFNDSDTNRDGYIAKQDELEGKVKDLETKNKITAGKIAVSVMIFSAVGSFFLWMTSMTWK
jgi:hypothetical protein